jgi:hypothetical protein
VDNTDAGENLAFTRYQCEHSTMVDVDRIDDKARATAAVLGNYNELSKDKSWIL